MKRMTENQAVELRNSSLWGYVCDELDVRMGFELDKLKSCNQQDLPYIQNKIKSLIELKQLPESVISRESVAGSDLPESSS